MSQNNNNYVKSNYKNNYQISKINNEMMKIPVFDFRIMRDQPELVKDACKRWGCFRLINHSVPTQLMRDMKSTAKQLFQRPFDIKRKIKETIVYTGYRETNERNPSYEAFDLHDANPPSVSSFCSGLEVSPQQSEIIKGYTRATSKLAMDVAGKVAKSFGLEDYNFSDWPLEFRVNKYDGTVQKLFSSGVQAHTDDGLLSLVQEDEQLEGLQVKAPSGCFVMVRCEPWSFFVTIGDLAVVWSNGELLNCPHFVQITDIGTRLSSVTSIAPSLGKAIEPEPHFVKEDRPPIYVPLTYGDLRKTRFAKKMHVGQVLSEFLSKGKRRV